ncbi:segregation/condensation protein A [Moorella naiadis]|uniref:segregation and condensation protein A n=1 Tax=Moorella naiadis (nom. illeg.) TaxID=3093670 RepID=UPI003D9CA608
MLGNVRLDVFQGPLDLLLTLIEKQEIDVQAIPVAEVTAQYLEYLGEVEELDLEWASEFLILGTELLALKARLLLQRPVEDEPEEKNAEETARALAERLQAYRCYKRAAEHLGELAAAGALIFTRPKDQEAVVQAMAGINPLEGVTPLDLARALAHILARKGQKKEADAPRVIPCPAFTLAGQVRHIWRRLHQEKSLSLEELLSKRPTRLEVALTFLALLELARRGRIIMEQKVNFGNIEVQLLPHQVAR